MIQAPYPLPHTLTLAVVPIPTGNGPATFTPPQLWQTVLPVLQLARQLVPPMTIAN